MFRPKPSGSARCLALGRAYGRAYTLVSGSCESLRLVATWNVFVAGTSVSSGFLDQASSRSCIVDIARQQ